MEMFIWARIQKSSLNWGSQICFSSNDIECGFVQTEFAPFPAYLAGNSEFGWMVIALVKMGGRSISLS